MKARLKQGEREPSTGEDPTTIIWGSEARAGAEAETVTKKTLNKTPVDRVVNRWGWGRAPLW